MSYINTTVILFFAYTVLAPIAVLLIIDFVSAGLLALHEKLRLHSSSKLRKLSKVSLTIYYVIRGDSIVYIAVGLLVLILLPSMFWLHSLLEGIL